MIVFQTRVTWAADEPLPFGRGETGPGCRRRSFDERQVVYRCCAAMGFQTGFYRFPVRRSAPPRSSPATAQNAAGVPQNTAGMLLLTAVILLEPHGAGTKYTAIAIHGDEEGANSTRTWASTTIGAKADQLVTLAKKNARVRVGLTTILIIGKSGAPTTGNQHYRGSRPKASDVLPKIAAVICRQ
jgi:hypothetical protein